MNCETRITNHITNSFVFLDLKHFFWLCFLFLTSRILVSREFFNPIMISYFIVAFGHVPIKMKIRFHFRFGFKNKMFADCVNCDHHLTTGGTSSYWFSFFFFFYALPYRAPMFPLSCRVSSILPEMFADMRQISWTHQILSNLQIFA